MHTMIPESISARLEKAALIAVLIIDRPDDAVPLARVLLENGVTAMELTLRTPSAINALIRIRSEVPQMLAGVGTILSADQAVEAKTRGAEFGVAPGFNAAVLDCAADIGLPFAPGIATPSEIEGSFAKGCRILKFFHAEGMGGLKYLSGIHAPYRHLGLRYIPLGGVGPSNLADYLECPDIIAVGGSWIAPRDSIEAHDWRTIGRNAKEAMEIARRVGRTL